MARCFLSPKDRKIAAFLQVAGAARAGFAEFASGKTSFAPFAEGRRPGGCRSWGRNGLRFEGCGMHCGSRVVERTAVRAAAACRIICRAGEGRSFAVRAGRMLRSPSGRGRTPRSAAATPRVRTSPCLRRTRGRSSRRAAPRTGCRVRCRGRDRRSQGRKPSCRRCICTFSLSLFLVEHALRRGGTCRFSVDGAYCVPECGCEGRFFLDYFA